MFGREREKLQEQMNEFRGYLQAIMAMLKAIQTQGAEILALLREQKKG